jgi:hypothetical protein
MIAITTNNSTKVKPQFLATKFFNTLNSYSPAKAQSFSIMTVNGEKSKYCADIARIRAQRLESLPMNLQNCSIFDLNAFDYSKPKLSNNNYGRRNFRHPRTKSRQRDATQGISPETLVSSKGCGTSTTSPYLDDPGTSPSSKSRSSPASSTPLLSASFPLAFSLPVPAYT